MDINLLKKLGFSDKMAKIYLILLSLGPSSVRKLADNSGLNRGVIYEVLKELQKNGIVRYYKEDTKQLFVVEDPENLHNLIKKQENDLHLAEEGLNKLIPELQALYNPGGHRPVARYYHSDELCLILEDILSTCESKEESLYRIYSAAGVREYLYDKFETFSDVRVAKGINVKVIALGEGGELRGLDERKWLKVKNYNPTYIIIYPGKTAYISLDAKKDPLGVVIENDGVYQTQKEIFDELWNKL